MNYKFYLDYQFETRCMHSYAFTHLGNALANARGETRIFSYVEQFLCHVQNKMLEFVWGNTLVDNF